ncbi:SDR family oxidoreductase [Pararhizobium gei]|uniref:SDR family oxidoreductase n=1 Tax=Pararhizobium gei TaxID=1395951 RepID=UPI0030844123
MTHVIITGGSSGIGLAIAGIYASRGAHISLLARNLAALESAQALLGKKCDVSTIHIESVDVADRTETEDTVRRCEDRFGPCTILIACAGVVEPGPFETISVDDFDRQLQTNLFGAVHAVRAVYPAMKARRSGRIMLVSSGAGLIGIYGYTAYCASKFALHGFAEALRSEAKPSGVKIGICFPPDTETPQFTRELETRPREAAVVMGSVAPWPAAKLAERIVDAIDKGRFETFFDLTLWLLGRFGSVAKPMLNLWFDRAIARINRP